MSEYILNIHDTVLIATAFQCLLFIILMLTVKHDRRICDYFLVGFFIAQIAIAMHLLANYNPVIRSQTLSTSPNLLHLFDIAFWIEGPLLLWYTRSILNKNFTLKKKDAIYLIPSIAYCVFMYFIFYSLAPIEKQTFLSEKIGASAPSMHHALEAVRECLRVMFGVLCLVYIRRARTELRDRYSNIEKIDMNWLSVLVVAFTAVRAWILCVVIVALFAPNLDVSIFNFMGLAGNYLTFALITALMFLSLQRSSFFDGHLTEEDATADSEEKNLDPELAQKIENHMQQNKPYLMPLLNLNQLASELSMPPRTLSVAIKTNFRTNFYEFVNSYRINEAKSILSDSSQNHKTMIEISGECGFNSKATYNTFFKRLEGCTPTQFRAKNLVID
ncbi:MAG: helix-turn-helix domain-containing protein [Acidiferrobacterales bacterium]|nr:helix-turn-helix domain-containing protein [Acidiferrobacterales bacterium]